MNIAVEITKAEALGAVQAVISSSHQQECPVILLWNHPGQITFSFLKDLSKVVALWGVTVFQVAAHSVINNETQINLETMVGNVRLLGGAWHCLVVVVMSDDPAFLAAFAHLSLKRHALRWSTRILILTRLPLSRLGGLHDLLSNRNAMLLLIRDDEKEIRFSSAPRLTLVIEQMAHDFISWVEDPEAPEKRRLAYTGHIDNTVKYFAKAMNFTTFGTKLPDGSWTGMMGMVVRETVDFGAVPFMISPVRAEAGDYTSAIWTGNMKIVSGLSGLQINPWGFLLPLTPLVWASTLAALLGVLTVLLFLTSCLSRKTKSCGGWSANTSSSVRVLLQQDVVWPAQWWWWERLVLGLWMLTTLVLTKSYAGNLMSLLAVRHVPQPFQTPRDVLDDPHVAMIWQKYSKNEQFLRDVEFGIFRKVADLENEGRLMFHTQAQFQESLDTLVRTGRHVLVDMENNIRGLVASDVSKRSRCDFYLSRDGFLPFSAVIMSQKTNPIIHGLNRRFTSAPTLTVAIELLPHHSISWVEDPEAPEGRRLAFTGYMDKTIRYFAQGMNFTPRYVLSPERTFGTKLPDGSWTGMMGMVVREEVDFGAGPFMLSPVRAAAGDHTTTIWTGNVKMVSGLRGLKVDPWGFLLPLTPLVWAATLTALFGVLWVLQLLSTCLRDKTLCRGGWSTNTFSSVRVVLQQDVVWPAQWWWWERLVLGLWMLTTLVLTKSYAGNLMSLLADVASGVFREVADLEKEGRLKFHTQAQFLRSLDTLVRAGDHVLVDIEITIRNLIALDVSRKGRCDFYLSRDGFLPYSSAIMSQKTNPLIHGLNSRVIALTESGLFKYWMQDVPNFTTCNSVPKTVLFTTTLSTTNLWVRI
ncbi:Glutamate receptor 2 [Portunus trituberculatus]|uniref:Glutamate receptor 2 n=1 Tax=Portunus trituberculatus TaxID=210409 RepID=A0A5B7D6G8_PORTR|nr:Glutamate receptor 2 [Portunus trituberculatus]